MGTLTAVVIGGIVVVFVVLLIVFAIQGDTGS